MNNPFGLVYEDAITENLPGRVQIRPVTYEVEGSGSPRICICLRTAMRAAT